MESDSRTATASKARPSWRDRHLSQLSDEQLDEVSQHRGGDSVPESGMAGVKSDSSPQSAAQSAAQSASEGSAQRSVISNNSTAASDSNGAGSAKLPRQQTRPVREDASQSGSRDQYQKRHRSDHRLDDNRYRASVRDSSRRDHRIDSADNHSLRDGGNHQYHHDADRRRSDRYALNERLESRDAFEHDTRSNDESDGRVPRVDASAETQSENKQGFVNKVLDFTLPAPVKYGLMALAVAVMVAVSLLKPIDNSSQSQLDSAFTRAMIGFGLAKALNGVISVAQGTEFAVQPAGVGVNFSPGEILDPVNDLVEQFSTIMLLATSAIGIQQILLQISSWAGISVLLAGAGVFFLLTRMRNSAIARLADFAGKLLLAMLLVRFLIPIGALANDWVYQQFLQPQYEESSAQLEVASERIKEISTRQAEVAESDGSITDRAKRLYSSMTSKFDFDGMLDDYKQSADAVSENAINLIVVFVLQTIIFPLLFMYLIYRLFRFVIVPPRS